MDRQLTVEFPWLLNTTDPGAWEPIYATDSRRLTSVSFVQETKIDLSGYVQSDLTVGFRRSFEQQAGTEFLTWDSYDPSTDYFIETVIISSVPMSDEQLTSALVGSPGFTNFPNPGLEWGNFNKAHIIHGSYKVYYANSIVGSGDFARPNSSTLVSVVDNVFSSLEPTAADCLYCYRVFGLPNATQTEVNTIQMPAKRVILDAFTVEEPDLEYMMRLKRSYELANQV